MDRRAVPEPVHTQDCEVYASQTEPITTLQDSTPTEPPNPADSAELLKKYRAALVNAYELGKSIRETYGIVPPKVLYNGALSEHTYLAEDYKGWLVTITLGVS
jgi:hypothetical protein